MDWDEAAARLGNALLAAFDDLLPTLAGERLYALALVTEDDAGSVGVAANTEETFARHLAAGRAGGDPLAPGDIAWYRWGVGEWRHEGWRDDLFADLNRLLFDGRITPSGQSLDRLCAAMTAALERLRRDRVDALARVTLFITLTDSDAAEEIEDASAARLNPPDLLAPFLARYAG